MTKVNYDGRRFRAAANSANGEVSSETVFHYHQSGNTVWAEYRGGDIVRGHLLASASDDGSLAMQYHHINAAGQLMAGTCSTTPEVLDDGRLRLHEAWQWSTGDRSRGTSTLEEIA